MFWIIILFFFCSDGLKLLCFSKKKWISLYVLASSNQSMKYIFLFVSGLMTYVNGEWHMLSFCFGVQHFFLISMRGKIHFHYYFYFMIRCVKVTCQTTMSIIHTEMLSAPNITPKIAFISLQLFKCKCSISFLWFWFPSPE